MFSLIKIKTLRVSNILMSTALISYLVLFLAGSVLHNHPVNLGKVSAIGEAHSDSHDCCGRCNHSRHDDHHGEEGHHNCPVCYFNAIASGSLPFPVVIFLIFLSCWYVIFYKHNRNNPFHDFLQLHLRAPPCCPI